MRRSDDRLIAGVAAGLADHLRLDPLVVRAAFAVLTLTVGVGIVAYAAFWAVVPLDPTGGASARREADRRQLLGVGALALGVLLLLGHNGLWLSGPLVWPLLLGGAGVALLWVQADEATRRRWYRAIQADRSGDTGVERRVGWLRVGAGALLLVAGVGGFLAAVEQLQAARDGIVAIVAVLVGVALVSGPWWWRLVTDLTEERRARIRSEERAELAARVHDSVLQTLTLIQRRADSPREVVRLARGQERELRRWLYDDPGAPGPHDDRVAAALARAAAEVEDDHDVRIEVVTVGDAALDERLGAVVLAAREAMVNAAKFSGCDRVDVYAEVADGELAVFVRDVGVGFDPAAVAADRRGIADSIVGRLRRVGGTAVVRSEPGGGTEVELVVGGVRGG